MKAVILAAGRGSRMGSSTETKPKCMAELGGRTLLSLQCAALKNAGVTAIAAVVGYQAESFANTGLKLFANPRWAESNMVVSLACAAAWLSSEPCIVSYGDIFYSPDIVSHLITCKDDIAIAYDPAWLQLWERRFSDPLADAETFEIDAENWIRIIGGRPASIAEIQGQYMGLLRFTPTGWASVESYLMTLLPEVRDRMDMTNLLMNLINHGHYIRGVLNNGQWGEVDSTSDLALYEGMIHSNELVIW